MGEELTSKKEILTVYDAFSKDYVDGMKAGMQLAEKICLDNGIELKFPNIDELRIEK